MRRWRKREVPAKEGRYVTHSDLDDLEDGENPEEHAEESEGARGEEAVDILVRRGGKCLHYFGHTYIIIPAQPSWNVELPTTGTRGGGGDIRSGGDSWDPDEPL